MLGCFDARCFGAKVLLRLTPHRTASSFSLFAALRAPYTAPLQKTKWFALRPQHEREHSRKVSFRPTSSALLFLRLALGPCDSPPPPPSHSRNGDRSCQSNGELRPFSSRLPARPLHCCSSPRVAIRSLTRPSSSRRTTTEKTKFLYITYPPTTTYSGTAKERAQPSARAQGPMAERRRLASGQREERE